MVVFAFRCRDSLVLLSFVSAFPPFSFPCYCANLLVWALGARRALSTGSVAARLAAVFTVTIAITGGFFFFFFFLFPFIFVFVSILLHVSCCCSRRRPVSPVHRTAATQPRRGGFDLRCRCVRTGTCAAEMGNEVSLSR